MSMQLPLLNQQLIKAKNLKTVFSIILDEGGISRAEIAKRTALSKPTISSLVEELIQKNFIVDSGKQQVSNSVGRRPNTLFALEKQHFIPVVTWTKDKVIATLLDIFGTAIDSQELMVTGKEEYTAATKKLFTLVCNRKTVNGTILGCCLILPGMIDSAHNTFYSHPLGIHDTNAMSTYEKIHECCSDYPLAVLQDTACYAYAEKVFANITEENFAFINFNQGIGASLFIEGRMLGKANGAFTQFGHYSINPEGDLCTCGNRGCLENEIGEGSLEHRVPKVPGCKGNRIEQFGSYKALGTAVRDGDTIAQQVLNSLASDFAQALRNLISIVNPSLIILGGRCQNLGASFLASVQSSIDAQGFGQMTSHTTIQYTSLDSDSYLKGAVRYFFDMYYEFSDALGNPIYIG
ncbi:ROK family transcriptional regulator [Sediminispirochaeta bajacaliforniensis]|uniref:ROK family transcriptional regulator n=1 Tax=Sediminispirochaeta bajacaliforniensis TaxID=148 RepID=UPI0003625B30|nr:ROK family transcriptional regulator [Sediminispirochaeta bajacaliforniensis]